MGTERNSKIRQWTIAVDQRGDDGSLDPGAVEREGEEVEF